MKSALLMILMVSPVIWEGASGALAFCFEEAGNQYGISPLLLQTIAQVESGMNPRAIGFNPNGSTDLGLMQINSSWIETLQLRRDYLLGDPCYNVKMGARILKSCIDSHGYTWQAIGHYNAVAKEKQLPYCWKIYRALKKNKGCNAPVAQPVSPSLTFQIRDTSTPDLEGNP